MPPKELPSALCPRDQATPQCDRCPHACPIERRSSSWGTNVLTRDIVLPERIREQIARYGGIEAEDLLR